MLNRMMFIFCVALSLVCGCHSASTDFPNGKPIVSPTVHSTESADSSEPQIPHYEPIWYNLNP